MVPAYGHCPHRSRDHVVNAKLDCFWHINSAFPARASTSKQFPSPVHGQLLQHKINKNILAHATRIQNPLLAC